MLVLSKEKIFGSQPYLAIKTVDDRYLWENFDKLDEKKWRFVFDEFHVNLNLIELIGVAANSISAVMFDFEMANLLINKRKIIN